MGYHFFKKNPETSTNLKSVQCREDLGEIEEKIAQKEALTVSFWS